MAFPSFMSVHIEAVRPSHEDPDDLIPILQGTGFVLDHDLQSYLITNGHIVTGRDRKTNEPLGSAALPKQLRVVIPIVSPELDVDEEARAILGTRTVTLDLYDESGGALWFSHPLFGRKVDVVALPLDEPVSLSSDLHGIYLPYRFAPVPPHIEPPDEVSIVGFPYGLRGGASTAIWVRGTIATEPVFPYEGESCFLVDARTREGQSGSPVILYPSHGPHDSSEWQLLGVYASRVTDPLDSRASTDLGRVWTASAIRSVVDGQVPDDLRYE